MCSFHVSVYFARGNSWVLGKLCCILSYLWLISFITRWCMQGLQLSSSWLTIYTIYLKILLAIVHLLLVSDVIRHCASKAMSRTINILLWELCMKNTVRRERISATIKILTDLLLVITNIMLCLMCVSWFFFKKLRSLSHSGEYELQYTIH